MSKGQERNRVPRQQENAKGHLLEVSASLLFKHHQPMPRMQNAFENLKGVVCLQVACQQTAKCVRGQPVSVYSCTPSSIPGIPTIYCLQSHQQFLSMNPVPTGYKFLPGLGQCFSLQPTTTAPGNCLLWEFVRSCLAITVGDERKIGRLRLFVLFFFPILHLRTTSAHGNPRSLSPGDRDLSLRQSIKNAILKLPN